MKERSRLDPVRNFVMQLGGESAILHYRILVSGARLCKVDRPVPRAMLKECDYVA